MRCVDYSRAVSAATTRRVWAALTANPRLSQRRMALHLGIGATAAYYALRRLDTLGYIRWDRAESGGAWAVVVPFRIIGKGGDVTK